MSNEIESPRVLTPEQSALVRGVRGALQDLRVALARAAAEPEDEQLLQSAVDQLEDFFLLVVVGEFNAGKSALINALLGERVLTEGVTPTTTDVQVLRHTEQPATGTVAGLRTVSASAPLLRHIHLVDTPGTNAITREHEVLTRRFVPRADLILFVTSADRPFTESERQFMKQIREWGKKVVIVINKADLLTTAEDHRQVLEFVRDNVRSLLEFTPEVFPVSARGALAAKLAGDPQALGATGFPALEHYVLTTLSDEERFRLKLLSPLGVGLRLVETYAATVTRRLDLLRQDAATVEEIRVQLDGFRREMTRTFQLRLADVDNLLHQFEKRGDDFFEETVRVGRIFDLVNKSRIKLEFERQVIGDLPQQVERRVQDLIDWLVASDLQQWTDIRDRLASRRSEHADRVTGRLAGGFDYDRARLLDTVGRSAQDTLDRHDQRAEASRMADSVQMAVTSSALLEVGAVGLGTAVSLLATSTAVDVTGIFAAGVLASVGFVIIPYRRKRAKRELRERIAVLREQLMAALGSQFQAEVERSARRVEEAIAPYVQFVEGERANLADRQQALADLQERLTRLRSDIEAA